MNKKEKELLTKQLKDEKAVIDELRKAYEQAEQDIQDKIDHLLADNLTQSKIYQLEYQKALKGQISAILDNMDANNYTSLQDYLKGCYEDGYIGTMYDLADKGIPLVIPIDQEAAVKAITLDSKISEGLYTKMNINTKELKKSIAAEVTRGISGAFSYSDISRNLNNQMKIGLNKAIRIARTEGHRVVQEATMDGARKAKDEGADIVKQWDATMDRKTRPSHQRVDGEIRELDEPFSNGLQFPGDPDGAAKEVINCRCVLLRRAKWALDEDELDTLKKRAEYFGLDKTETFEQFKKKYLEASTLTEKQIAIIGDLNMNISQTKEWMKTAQQELAQFDTEKQYVGLWKEPVTIKDYQAKKMQLTKKSMALQNNPEMKKMFDEFATQGYKYNEKLKLVEKYQKDIAKYMDDIDKVKKGATPTVKKVKAAIDEKVNEILKKATTAYKNNDFNGYNKFMDEYYGLNKYKDMSNLTLNNIKEKVTEQLKTYGVNIDGKDKIEDIFKKATGCDTFVATDNGWKINKLLREKGEDALKEFTEQEIKYYNYTKASKIGEDMVVYRLVNHNAVERYLKEAGGSATAKLEELIEKASEDILSVKNTNYTRAKKLLDEINNTLQDTVLIDNSYTASSYDFWRNIFTENDYVLKINVPKNTSGAWTFNDNESEIDLAPGTKIKFKYASIDEFTDKVGDKYRKFCLNFECIPDD